MAITESTVITRVSVHCNCDGMNASNVIPYNGTIAAIGAESIPVETTDADQLAQLDIMQAKIDDGTAELWYQDGGNIWIEYDDLQDVHGLIHAMHPMRPATRQPGGHHVLPNIVKNRRATPKTTTPDGPTSPPSSESSRRSASRTATPSTTRSKTGTHASSPARKSLSSSTSPPTTT